MSEERDSNGQELPTAYAILKKNQAAFALAYDAVRPTGEVDSRAKSVLVTSVILIALSLSDQRPDSISLLGMSFQAHGWIVLGVPLAVIDFYYIAQLLLAWSVNHGKTDHAIVDPLTSVLDGLQAVSMRKEAELEVLSAKAVAFAAEAAGMTSRRNEILEWYKAESEKIQKLNSLSPIEVLDNFERVNQEREDLRAARSERLRQAGVEEYDQRVKAYLDVWMEERKAVSSGDIDPNDTLMRDVSKNMNRLVRIRRARTTLDIAVPLFIALFSFSVFTLALFFPSQLTALSAFLSRSR